MEKNNITGKGEQHGKQICPCMLTSDCENPGRYTYSLWPSFSEAGGKFLDPYFTAQVVMSWTPNVGLLVGAAVNQEAVDGQILAVFLCQRLRQRNVQLISITGSTRGLLTLEQARI